jgi:hypothetical protein
MQPSPTAWLLHERGRRAGSPRARAAVLRPAAVIAATTREINATAAGVAVEVVLGREITRSHPLQVATQTEAGSTRRAGQLALPLLVLVECLRLSLLLLWTIQRTCCIELQRRRTILVLIPLLWLLLLKGALLVEMLQMLQLVARIGELLLLLHSCAMLGQGCHRRRSGALLLPLPLPLANSLSTL